MNPVSGFHRLYLHPKLLKIAFVSEILLRFKIYFCAWQEWLKENGPFAAVLDGANIGMYNSALRGFNYKQVKDDMFYIIAEIFY